jgi:hypothetical protein
MINGAGVVKDLKEAAVCCEKDDCKDQTRKEYKNVLHWMLLGEEGTNEDLLSRYPFKQL